MDHLQLLATDDRLTRNDGLGPGNAGGSEDLPVTRDCVVIGVVSGEPNRLKAKSTLRSWPISEIQALSSRMPTWWLSCTILDPDGKDKPPTDWRTRDTDQITAHSRKESQRTGWRRRLSGYGFPQTHFPIHGVGTDLYDAHRLRLVGNAGGNHAG